MKEGMSLFLATFERIDSLKNKQIESAAQMLCPSFEMSTWKGSTRDMLVHWVKGMSKRVANQLYDEYISCRLNHQKSSRNSIIHFWLTVASLRV
jgi:hypothetical protein